MICYKNGNLYKQYLKIEEAEVDTNGNTSRYPNRNFRENHFSFVGIKSSTNNVKHYAKDKLGIPSDNQQALGVRDSFDAFGYYDERLDFLDCFYNIASIDDYVAKSNLVGLPVSSNVSSLISDFGQTRNDIDSSLCIGGIIGAITYIDGVATDSKVYFNVLS